MTKPFYFFDFSIPHTIYDNLMFAEYYTSLNVWYQVNSRKNLHEMSLFARKKQISPKFCNFFHLLWHRVVTPGNFFLATLSNIHYLWIKLRLLSAVGQVTALHVKRTGICINSGRYVYVFNAQRFCTKEIEKMKAERRWYELPLIRSWYVYYWLWFVRFLRAACG